MSSLLSPPDGARLDDLDADPEIARSAQRRKIIRIAALVLFWVVAVIVTLIAIGTSTVPAGTSVVGVDIGGLDRQSAVNKLSASLQDRASTPISLKIGETTAEVEPDALGLSLNVDATVDSVITSRTDPFDVWKEFFGGGEAVPVARLDEATFKGKLQALSEKYSNPMKEPEIVYTGTTPQLSDPATGTNLNQDAAAEVILANYLQSANPVSLPMDEVQPTVTSEQARSVLDGPAQNAVDGPITMKAGDVTTEIAPTDLAAALSYQVADGQMKPVVDGAKLHESLTDELANVDTPAHDASWDVTSGKPVLVPSQSGNGVSDDQLSSSVVGVLDKSGNDRAVDVRIGPLEPTLTTEEAAALNVNEQISTFTQKFNYAAYRVQNIGQAAKKIDKTLLLPGETFSFNDTVGQRTKANGFVPGTVVGEGGRFKEDMGGGVSAAATTVWTAAFFGGLESVEHGSHLIWISRYQPGLEATVSWGTLDLRLKNNSPNGIYITTNMTNTGLTVSMWGTKQFDEIKAESGEKYNVTPFHKEVASGPSCVPQEGSDGFNIDVDRVFIRGGAEVGREKFSTGYIPGAEVQCVSGSSSSTSGSGSSGSDSSSSSSSSNSSSTPNQ